MSTGDALADFIHEALAKKVSRADITSVLVDAGWEPQQVQDALSFYADVDFLLPVPMPRAYASPRYALVVFVMFFALYLMAGALVFHIYAIVDWRIGPKTYYESSMSRIQYSCRGILSVLVIVSPVYFWLNHFLNRAIARDSTVQDSKARKWLIHLTLVACALIVIGAMIATLGRILNINQLQESWLALIGREVALMVLASMIFVYYLNDLEFLAKRLDRDRRVKIRRCILSALAVWVVAVSLNCIWILLQPVTPPRM